MKTDLYSFLLQRLTDVRKLVILGVGSELMQDDAAGVAVTQNLIKKYGEDNTGFRIISAYTNPENFTRTICDYNPDHIVIIDAADLTTQPGTVKYIPVEAINDLTVGTHKISLIMMIEYLRKVINCEFTVIAIQYKSVGFNCRMTREVQSGVRQITGLLSDIINDRFHKNNPPSFFSSEGAERK